MVRLTKIYTKTGDDGTTGLGDGSRVPKTDPRVEAFGTVDEANAAIGACLAGIPGSAPDGAIGAIADLLKSIQNDLFDVGADLCRPVAGNETPGSRLRMTPEQTARLERAIDHHNEHLAPLNSFILPGGTALAAGLHVARTVVRRAERLTVALGAQAGGGINPESIRYLNRLSDLLFVLARVANDGGKSDVLWVPGANRK
jgi:cob(I)alamin adenosyltransferase